MKRQNGFAQLKERQREASRNIIIEAAERVFAAKPFNKISMRDIAKEAEISPASIYTYFADQGSLFVEASVRGARHMLDQFKASMEDSRECYLQKAAETFIQYLTEHDAYFRMMGHFMLHAQVNPTSVEKLNAVEHELLDVFDTAFENMHAKGNVRLLSHVFFSALNGILISFRNFPGRSEAEVVAHMNRLARVLVDVFMAGTADVEPTRGGGKSS